jgi:cytoskeletal protein RodZ
MSSFGEELRRERELRRISLREISESTKINVRYLDALERNDFKHLPGGVFNKGFVRAYAQYIGVDPDSMVNSYLLEESAQSRDETRSGEVFRPTDGGALRSASDEPTPATESNGGSAKTVLWSGAALVLVAALAVGGWFLWSWLEDRQESAADDGVKAVPKFALTGAESPPEKPDDGEAAAAEKQEPPAEPAVEKETEAAPTPVPVKAPPKDPVIEESPPEPVETPTPEPPRPSRLSGTSLTATLSLERPTSGRVNCDNRRVETLDGLAAGTRMSFECRRFLLIDAEDGGALLLGLGDADPEPLAEDGVRVQGHHVAPPPEPREATP